MRRSRRLGLTAEGGIIFGAVMLVVVIVLVIRLFTWAPDSGKDEGEAGKVWAQLLTTSDMARLGRLEETAEP
ncbi:MAG: hypothetical protein IKU11_00440 [Clostridia bacterium]|nr:hypothetical protein [Clostridia bacterium]